MGSAQIGLLIRVVERTRHERGREGERDREKKEEGDRERQVRKSVG